MRIILLSDIKMVLSFGEIIDAVLSFQTHNPPAGGGFKT